MRQINFALAAGCIVGATGLLLALASGAEKPAAEKPASEKIIYSFAGGSDGANPQSDLILDSAGNLYGTTSQGGVGCNGQGCGTVFELKRSGGAWKKEVLHNFTGDIEGSYPAAGLVFDSLGNLYGTTGGGGANYGQGTVFKLTPTPQGGWAESILYVFPFNGSAGTNPTADLVLDSKGNLYGTTPGGASGRCGYDQGCGGVFELTPHPNGTWTETTIHSFTGGADGGQPASGVVLDSMGNVYGMTYSGGAGKCLLIPEAFGCGTVYEFSPNSGGGWTETVIYTFARGGGYAVNPSWGLILNNTGELFGTSIAGGDGYGTVLELRQSKRGWEQNIVHRFYGNPDGIQPVGKIEMNKDGALFGVTSGGGTGGYGIVFELKRSQTGDWRERILHSFTHSIVADGYILQAGVVLDSRGHLFGTTVHGGTGTGCSGGCGTVYEITP